MSWTGAYIMSWNGAYIMRWKGAYIMRWKGAYIMRWKGAYIMRWKAPGEVCFISVSQKSFEDTKIREYWLGGCFTQAWTIRQLLTFCSAALRFIVKLKIHLFVKMENFS
jgi:hypothetical protein